MALQRPDKETDNREQARAFAIEAARLAFNTRCHGVVVLDVAGISPITNFLVIGTGTSDRQMRTIIDQVQELGQARGFKPFSASGLESKQWMLIDFVDVIVHVFSQEARFYYDLENLWGDGQRVEWESAQPAKA